MSEKEIAIHNIALLYSIHKELHPDDTEMTLEMIAANYSIQQNRFRSQGDSSVISQIANGFSFLIRSLFCFIADSKYFGSNSASP